MPTTAIKTAKPAAPAVTASHSGLQLSAYRGDGAVLLAFNLKDAPKAGFAGFAVKCTPPSGKTFYLKNRLTFDKPVTSVTTPAQRHAQLTGTDQAPYQKFRWIDFSSSQGPGVYAYEVSDLYHGKNGALKPRATTSVSINLGPFVSGSLQVGFTRGFLSSQAYVDRFHNAPIRPDKKSIDYDTKPYQAQYTWLGFHARELMFNFLNQALADPQSELDVFAYDLDEPDIISLLKQFKSRLRAVLDNAPLHTKPGAMEILAKQLLLESAGASNIKTGHFQRFSHCKVFILKKGGKPVRVLTGSTNFSVRGLYAQANNVLVFDDAETAGYYSHAFDQAFEDMPNFAKSEIAEGWIDVSNEPGLPPFSVSFSPHKTADVSLDRVAQAIQKAKSSILFAIMELGGSGPVLSQIQALTSKRKDLFSYGVTQSLSGTSVYKPGSPNGVLTAFSFLQKHVPAPFSQEISGGPGQVIHDKFVVIDFDTKNPLVYTGSSNLAAGGEEQNGDNLLEIRDPAVASIFAVQGMGLVDHFHFRSVMQTATDDKPLELDPTDGWWKDYFVKSSLKFRDRNLFSPLSA